MTQCSDGIDNDGDGKIDYGDPECVGPLDNDEGTFATGIPGDNIDACKQDCFFDGNSGMGDDGCDWQLKCDPMTNNASCPYDAAYAQSHMTECSLSASQSRQVHRQLPQAGAERLRLLRLLHGSRRARRRFAWRRPAPPPTSTTRPSARACTQVTQCMVPCGRCEVCVGKPTIPADCYPYDGGVPDGGTPYTCPAGYMACGQYGIDPALCPEGTGCVTGCCRPLVP